MPQAISLLALLALSFGLSSLSGSLFSSSLSFLTLVEVEGVVLIANWYKETTSGHVLDEGTSDGASNLELLAEDSSGDAKDLWDFLEHSLVLLLIEEDGVVKLFLNLGLGPGLLLGLGTLAVLLL